MINSQKIKKHKEYKQIAICSYDINKHQLPQGYNLEGISTKDNGFYAIVVKKGNDVVIAYRGTELNSIKDIKNDLTMSRKLPEQSDNALQLVDIIKSDPDYQGCNITVVGHSLGGSLATDSGCV